MEKGRRDLGIGQLPLKCSLSVFELDHLGVDRVRRSALENQFEQLIQLTLDPPHFRPCRLDRGRALHPKAVHLACEFVAEFLEQRRVHQMIS